MCVCVCVCLGVGILLGATSVCCVMHSEHAQDMNGEALPKLTSSSSVGCRLSGGHSGTPVHGEGCLMDLTPALTPASLLPLLLVSLPFVHTVLF